MTSQASTHPKVFVSYSHDSREHMDRVLDLSNRLRREGIDCLIDQYEPSPSRGWARWTEDQIEQADFILVVCTETYLRRFRGKEEEGRGLGANWEGAIITQDLYDAGLDNRKVISVVFGEADAAHRPRPLRAFTYYDVSTGEGYTALYRHLTGQPLVVIPELGEQVNLPPRSNGESDQAGPAALPPKERKQTFTPISISYQNFDLQIRRSGDGYIASVQTPDSAEASHEFVLPFGDDKIESLIAKLGPTRSVRSAGDVEEQAAQALGGGLYSAVFAEQVGKLFHECASAAKRRGERLRLRLRLAGVPELAKLPWEYIYDESNDRFLVLDYNTSIVRYLEIPQMIRPLTVAPPLRVLVMTSGPLGYPALGIEKEWENLQQALSQMPQGMVEVERLERASLDALRERLSQGAPCHIFHYIGHGGFDQRTGQSVLVLEDENRQASFVDGRRLGTILYSHPQLRLVILNACEGAFATPADVFSGVAQNLIRQEMPAVVAMQFEITDNAAIRFARGFYESVARGNPVDTALYDARLAIYSAEKSVEWGTPVLYLRAPDGRLFEVNVLPPRKKAAEPSGSQGPGITPDRNLPPPPLPSAPPSGTLPPNSPFHIERKADTRALSLAAMQELTLTVQAIGQTGGSSLLRRLTDAGERAGKRVVRLDFQRAFNLEDLIDSEKFHQRFCSVVTNRLGKEDRVSQFWDKYQRLSIGDRCTNYMQYLLQSLGQQTLMLAMDEVDRLISARFRASFFALLRNWHNDRGSEPHFERLDIVFTTSLEPHELINDPRLSQSPWNVGEFVHLDDFNEDEVRRLGRLYGIELAAPDLVALMSIVGGHPYLVQFTFYQIATGRFAIDKQFIQSAAREGGPFGKHLSSWFALLRGNPELYEGMVRVLSHEQPKEEALLSLRKVGLIRSDGKNVRLRCKLYEDYFREQCHV